MRETTITRNTAETKINLALSLDGGETKIDTGCGFLNHMLVLFSRHGHFGLTLTCDGDTDVDYHHTAEDICAKSCARGFNLTCHMAGEDAWQT